MKKIITKELISLVQTAYNNALNESDGVEPLCIPAEIPTGISIGIGRVRICNGGPNSYLVLADDIGKSYMQDWKKDVGNVFIKDCKKNNLSVYYKFKNFDNGAEALLRRISDEEYDDFKEKGFVHLKLGDFYYMILKVVPRNGSYIDLETGDEDYFAHVDEPVEEEEEYKEEEQEIESLSLF